MRSAEHGFCSWAATSVAARRSALRRIADTTDQAASDLAFVLTREQGKPLRAARFEVQQVSRWFRHFAEMPLPVEVAQDDAIGYAEVVRRPLGVVAAITPWNFPLLLMAMKVAPALLAGNAVVLKPSPYTPLSTLAFGRLAAPHLPAGVLNVVSGGNELGAWMTAHPVVRKVSFTGSVPTGKAVAMAAAADLKRCTLELGGNDAAIVLADADPRQVLPGLFWGAFTNNGQVCAGIKRLYVPDRLHDDLLGLLAEKARAVRVGDGMEEGVQLGPVNNLPQLQRIGQLVDEAIASGARVAAGGAAIAGDGYFFQPTVLHDLGEGCRLVDEEQFGPVLPVLRYSDLDEAIARANATRYGLSGSVWGRNADRAEQIARRLHCGTIYVNTHLVSTPSLPFGGWQWSGLGVENGARGLDEFCQLQVTYRPH
ncbi:MAG: aldehyde dehydrogenase family protein, partial [Lautropia sp.]